MITPGKVAIAPERLPLYETAVRLAGGEVAPLDETVGALIWTDASGSSELARILRDNPQLQWVQLPWAGVDAFASMLNHPVRFTSAKGSYAEPVAEHALALSLALGRRIPDRVRARSWGEKFADSLYDSKVLIVGGGGIAEELIRQLAPFRADVTVVRNRPIATPGANLTVGFDELKSHIHHAKFVVLACALTDTTRGLFDAEMFARMKAGSYLVNVARGSVVVTADLLAALDSGHLAGAGIDVTDPEPLPDGHPAWENPKLIITPHTADTPEQVRHFFAIRVEANVSAYLGKSDWVGVVDPNLGY